MNTALARLEIQELLHRYGLAVDDRDFRLWDALFSADAVIDFRESHWEGNPQGWGLHTPGELRQILIDSSGSDRVTGQHLVLNSIIDVEPMSERPGSTASLCSEAAPTANAHSEFLAITVRRTGASETWHLGAAVKVTTGGWYDDELVHEQGSWRIRRRTSRIRWQSSEQLVLPEGRR